MKRFVFVLGAAIAWLVIAAPLLAQGGSAVVHFDPPMLDVGAGQVEQVNIVIENAHDIYGIDLRAQFDPSQIEIVDSDPSKDGVQMSPGDFIKPDFVVRNEADNTKGTFQYVVTQVNPTPPANGSGVVLTLLVRGKKQGKTASFTINFVQVANGKGVKLPIEPTPGTIHVVAPKQPTATPPVTGAAEPTRAATAVSTRDAAATRVRSTTVPVATVRQDNTDLLMNLGLGAVAVCGCLGALLVLGIAIFLLRRKPRPVPPLYPRM